MIQEHEIPKYKNLRKAISQKAIISPNININMKNA